MNRWECNYPGCTNSAVGVGGARGLRGLGWEFVPGQVRPVCLQPRIFCPQHRIDLKQVPCLEDNVTPCMPCAASLDANRLQKLWPNDGLPLPLSTKEGEKQVQ